MRSSEIHNITEDQNTCGNLLVSRGLEVGSKGSLLMCPHPGGGAAVVIVGEHVMVVNVKTGQHRGPGKT